MSPKKIILLTGLATFIFGFAAGALLNLYLLTINHPLVTQFRASLNYKSAVLGDGVLLPILNMQMVAFLIRYKNYLTKRLFSLGIWGGIIITAYFHLKQAIDGVVNWAMPTPWHWNILGFWHFFYMLAVTTLISIFYLVAFLVASKDRKQIKELALVSLGLLLFLFILRLDYIAIKLF